MKNMKRLIILWILTATAVVSSFAANKVSLFVNGPVDDADKFVIESRVSKALSGSGLTILERTQEFQSMLTQEQSYQLSGEVAPSEIGALGERWGATYSIGIYVVESRGTMVATAKLINVKTGRVLCTVSNHKACRTMDDVIVFAATLGVNLKREIRKYI